ncbi:MAG: redoxin family protein [Dehalococcoidia bacterium]
MTIKRCRIKSILIILATIILLAGIAGCVVPIGSKVGDKAPDFTLSTLDGGQIRLADLKGKTVVLVFWTTGCGACIYQMPFLEEAHDELGNDVEFVNINIGEDSYQVQAVIDYYGFSLPVALDSDEMVSTDYNIIYTPTNIIIDKYGVIHYVRKGAFTSGTEILSILNAME